MLPANFNDRLDEMMGVKFEEISRETQKTFCKDSADGLLPVWRAWWGSLMEWRVTCPFRFESASIWSMHP